MATDEKRLLRALKGAPVDRHPFWLMRQAGRYLPEYRALRAKAGGFLDLCLDPDLAAEITVQPVRRYGMDAAILFSDILLIPLALGQDLVFQEGEGPKLPALRHPSELARLAAHPDLTRLAPVYETIRKVRPQLSAETALIGFAGAPWTVATYMVEGGSSRSFEHVKRWAADDPDSFQILIDRITAATIAHLTAQIDAGVEVVQLFDSWAGTLEGAQFRRWVMMPAQTITTALKHHRPAVPVIGFAKGIGTRHLDYARATGVDAVSVEPELSLAFARDALQPIVAVQGNLDPLLLVAGGPAMESRIREILRTLGGGRFVFNLGHGVLPATPLDHVERLAEILRSTPA